MDANRTRPSIQADGEAGVKQKASLRGWFGWHEYAHIGR
jgi:hypothetical protein